MLASTGGLGLGGSTTFLLNLGRAFLAKGLNLPIVCMYEENAMAPEFATAQLPVYVVPRRKLIYEDRIRASYRYIASKRPAAVLACLGAESFEVLRLLPQHVVRMGIIQSDEPKPYMMARQYAGWLDAMIGVSGSICDRLAQDSVYKGVQPIRIEEIPYGIHFAPAQARPQRDPSKPLRIIYVGRMIEEQKRVSRLVELVKTLAMRGISFEFTFVGSGPDLASSRDALKEFSNVRFLGDVKNSEIASILRLNDVFVLLSDYEGLPLSLIEAMGEGVVPLVSDLESGMRDVVIPDNGIRVPVGDVAAAANSIASLALDPTRLASISAAASGFARSRYGSAIMAESYLKLVRDLSKGEPTWETDVPVPPPLNLANSWMYDGLPRVARRILKRFNV